MGVVSRGCIGHYLVRVLKLGLNISPQQDDSLGLVKIQHFAPLLILRQIVQLVGVFHFCRHVNPVDYCRSTVAVMTADY